MDDAIEICSGCGKMPRTIDRIEGRFVCSRCGNSSTIQVKSDDYEKVATELDAKFHAGIQKQKMEAAASVPIEACVSPKPASKKKSPAKKSASRKPAAVKKAAKKRK